MSEGHLVVTWSSDSALAPRQREKLFWRSIVWAASLTPVFVIAVLADHGWSRYGAGAVVYGAFFLAFVIASLIIDGRKLIPTERDRSMVEDNKTPEQALVCATFTNESKRTDRGVLTLIGENLVFVGRQASCTIPVEFVGANGVSLDSPLIVVRISAKSKQRESVEFVFMRTEPGEETWRQRQLLKAVLKRVRPDQA